MWQYYSFVIVESKDIFQTLWNGSDCVEPVCHFGHHLGADGAEWCDLFKSHPAERYASWYMMYIFIYVFDEPFSLSLSLFFCFYLLF